MSLEMSDSIHLAKLEPTVGEAGEEQANLRRLQGFLPLATSRQENWQGLTLSWPKFQHGSVEVAVSQQRFGISTRFCRRRCEQQ